MSERKTRSLGNIFRNSFAAAFIIASPATISAAEQTNLDNHGQEIKISEQSEPEASVDSRIFEQVDEFMETNTGKTLAGLFLVFSALNMLGTVHHGEKLDNKRKFTEALAASCSLLALAITLEASTVTEVDPKIPAS